MKQTSASRKVNETARSAFAQLLLTEFSDPRLSLLTVTALEVSKDRSVADVFVTADPSRYGATAKGLESAKGRLRSLLGKELGWRVTPELRFHIDTGLDHAMAINEALKNAPTTHASEDLGLEAAEVMDMPKTFADIAFGED
ncbi:MAG: 30S ribosome-binding factor RbfA [Coriobacteriia bacterium]|jgi:ribosome-binding factor A|nr:30S ribosome-binding factor RbfA [Coriobacteriia bacterium]MDR2714414.1 30S ribosome-binding factor RbfA [Coriobacteriales bacterium]